MAQNYRPIMSRSINSYVKISLGVLVLLLVAICFLLEGKTSSSLASERPSFLNIDTKMTLKTDSTVGLGRHVLPGARQLEGMQDYLINAIGEYEDENESHYEQDFDEVRLQNSTKVNLQQDDSFRQEDLEVTENATGEGIIQLHEPTTWKIPPNLPWVQNQLKVSPSSLMSLHWIKDLKAFLSTKVDKTWPIVLTSSNFAYRSSLVNWLAHSLVRLGNDSVKNALVLSMDEKLHSFLQKREIPSLLVTHNSLSSIRKNKWLEIRQIEVARLIVMRLINLWGYDVINYDNDAIILKNPQTLFDLYPDSNVIGSESFMPRDLHEKWGVTLCMGVVLMRASTATEQLWSAIHTFDVPDDQKKLNYALNRLRITWNKRDTTSKPWHGVAPIEINNTTLNFTVRVLPMDTVCRGPSCLVKKAHDYYVWHQGGDHSYRAMLDGASKARVWVLRKDWAELDFEDSITGKEWLKALMVA